MPCFRTWRSKSVTLPILLRAAYSLEDISRQGVWLGRHPAEKISAGPKDKLSEVGNLMLSAEAKAYLTVF